MTSTHLFTLLFVSLVSLVSYLIGWHRRDEKARQEEAQRKKLAEEERKQAKLTTCKINRINMTRNILSHELKDCPVWVGSDGAKVWVVPKGAEKEWAISVYFFQSGVITLSSTITLWKHKVDRLYDFNDESILALCREAVQFAKSQL